MTDPVAWFVLIGGSCLIVWGGARLGAGTHLSFAGLWTSHGRTDWPRGVQEGDTPRFAIDHADTLRPGTPMLLLAGDGREHQGPLDESCDVAEVYEFDGPAIDLIPATRGET